MADINYESPPLATEDKIVEDDQGRRRQIFAGQPVPPHLTEAYESEGGATEEGPVPPSAQNIAESDLTVEDASGRRRQVKAGQRVPVNLVDAYEEAGGTISNKTNGGEEPQASIASARQKVQQEKEERPKRRAN